jgi:hypothetical protein
MPNSINILNFASIQFLQRTSNVKAKISIYTNKKTIPILGKLFPNMGIVNNLSK